MDLNDLKIGVIGSGGRGGLAAHAHKPGEGSRVVACCDVNPEVLTANQDKYGDKIFVTDDYRELLKLPLDAVFICVPDFLHEQYAVEALQVGQSGLFRKADGDYNRRLRPRFASGI